jgi:signal transduction histidine kinase
VNLRELLNCVVEAARPAIESAGLNLDFHSCSEQLWLNADAVRLNQVFANLLSNAAKYSEHGGHITLSLCREVDSAIVAVKDSGQGIAMELVPHVFDLFVQGPGNEHRGLGVGLSLVKNLVEAHGGSVEAHSDGPGLGSEFVVRLPLV